LAVSIHSVHVKSALRRLRKLIFGNRSEFDAALFERLKQVLLG